MKLKRWVYRLGFRPRYGSVLFSPSLSIIYAVSDKNFVKAFEKGYLEGQNAVVVRKIIEEGKSSRKESHEHRDA